MKKLVLAILTLFVFIFWDIKIRLKYIFSKQSIESWVDGQFYRICEQLFGLTSFFVNVHIKYEQPDEIKLPETFMLIANHQSIQDIPLLIWSFPNHNLRFTAKDSLFRWIPMVSIMLRIQQHGRINRHGKAADTMKTIERVARKTKQGYCPVIFPEGTRSKTGEVGTFHQGAVRKMLAVNSIPVVCAAIEGGWRVGDVKNLVKNMEHIIEYSAEDIKTQVSIWREADRQNPKIKKGCHVKPN